MASTTAAVIVTGAYPTSSPTTLTSTTAIANVIDHGGVDADIVLSAGTATIYLLGWNATSASWMPIVSGAGDSSVDGGHTYLSSSWDRTLFTHYCLWEKTAAGPTYVPATKGFIIQK